ncbi:saccharopine dehydrogenase [Lysinibacter cavernae]|uniref:Saccharopine dehydrogenase n=1 Tax=Lysinibacter cavernae TaxID=1640652 RepID=A0A7X5TT45_9MICO|nr:saccharopine dehydrogenase [Lysinibacter cavernae]NIH53770.1 hypothetical protein [Lysinibacter cavernae]
MNRSDSRVLVLGGYGAVGIHIMNELRSRGITAHSAGRNVELADRPLDIRNYDDVGAESKNYTAVINATGAEDPHLAASAIGSGTTWIDITATSTYIDQLAALPTPTAPIIASVGIAPGLTNLLAVEAQHISTATGELSIGVLLGAGEAHGAAAAAWSFGLLGRQFRDPTTGRSIRNYTNPRTFSINGTPRRLYRTDFSDQHTLTPQLGRPAATYFGTDTRLATTLLAAATWIPGARNMPPSIHFPGSDTWILTIEDADGPLLSATGQSQSHATGIVAARAVEASIGAAAGFHHLTELTTLAELDLPFRVTKHRLSHAAPKI